MIVNSIFLSIFLSFVIVSSSISYESKYANKDWDIFYNKYGALAGAKFDNKKRPLDGGAVYLKIPHHDFEMLLMFDAEEINIKTTVVEKGESTTTVTSDITIWNFK